MTITVCIGSSCHLKGSKVVIEKLQELIEQNGLKDKIELKGSFCMGNCQNGVCVTIDDKAVSILPDTVEEVFNTMVLANA